MKPKICALCHTQPFLLVCCTICDRLCCPACYRSVRVGDKAGLVRVDLEVCRECEQCGSGAPAKMDRAVKEAEAWVGRALREWQGRVADMKPVSATQKEFTA